VTNPPDPLTAITHALENCRTLIPAVQARPGLAPRQGRYVPPPMVTLMDWERRQHAACRLTRKQDMARCVCDCHTGRPVAPAVETDLDDGFTGL
jgi:hypothetical protein